VVTKYRTIVADPPWRYTNERGTQTRSRAGRSAVTAEGNYPTMSNADISSLPVASLADKDCALYLWVTNPLIFRIPLPLDRLTIGPIDIVEAWGFRYITLLTWVKTGPPGLGFSFRGHTEHVIYATRGDVGIPPDRRESNVIVAPRRAHSQKPEAFYDLVERVSDGPYLEMFARNHHRLGWDVHGNESANTASLEAV
jgi:N6-adenosine-specific RNA methylase IME4